MRRMRWLICLFLVVAPTLAAAAPALSQGAQRPNVLFIAVDDLRPELGCYGASHIKSPNIDALARSALTFSRAYCQQSLCSPSRMSIMAGRRPDTLSIYDLHTNLRQSSPDVVTLSQHFKNNGYHAQGFGKIYHGGMDDEQSWSVPHTPNRAMQYCAPEHLAVVKKKGAQGWEQGGRNKSVAWEAADCADDALPDGWIADKAVEALREVKDKPFFLAVGFEKPHLPFVAPRKYFDLYPPAEQIELPANDQPPQGTPPIAMTDWAELRAYEGVPKKGPLPERQARELIRAYWACVSYADAQVGRLIAELERLGLRDRTLIVLWGDHGYQLLEQGLWCKHTNFENSVRVPLIISAPTASKSSAGARTDALVELIDVFPTLCELAGLPLPAGLEGHSLLPLFADPQKQIRQAALSQYPRRENNRIMGYSIRTDGFRYTEWQEDWRTDRPRVIIRELYDHRDDPRETVNVVDEPEHADVVKDLSKKLAKTRRRDS